MHSYFSMRVARERFARVGRVEAADAGAAESLEGGLALLSPFQQSSAVAFRSWFSLSSLTMPPLIPALWLSKAYDVYFVNWLPGSRRFFYKVREASCSW